MLIHLIGAISTGGAWYTGTKLEGVLQNTIPGANNELQPALVGSNSSATLELVTVETH